MSDSGRPHYDRLVEEVRRHEEAVAPLVLHGLLKALLISEANERDVLERKAALMRESGL